MVESAGRIPIEACVGGRELTEPRLAPDGRSVVYAEAVDAVCRLVIRHLATDGSAGPPRTLTDGVPVRAGRGLGGGGWCWSADGAAVVYAGVDGDLWWQPVGGGPAARMTGHGPDRAAQAPVASPARRCIVYVLDQSEVWSVGVGAHAGTVARLDHGAADFCFDPAVHPRSSTVVWQAWNIPDMPWDRSRLDGVPRPDASRDEPAGSVQQPRFAPDGTLACVRDVSGWANVWLGDRHVVDEPYEHAGPTWGLGQCSFAIEPSGRRIAFTRNEAGFGRLCVVEVSTGEVTTVGRGVHGQLSWAVGDHINRIAALRSGARTPLELVVYDVDRDFSRSTIDAAAETEWDRDVLTEPEPVVIRAEDGAALHARLYRSDAGGRGAPPRLICWLHGGPTDQWQVTFMPRLAYWGAQGWHVLVPDHRGSTGHGRDYQQALAGRWGELDVTDTIDAVRHAHRAGWAGPERTVLIGSSAGGFTVLGVLARDPHLAAAAVVSYPVSDLADLAERSHRFERHSTWSLVGPPGASAEMDRRYRERSPVWFAPTIRTPLLIFHGDADPVVPVDQSRVLAERIRAAGGDVELVVRPGEGHGFRRRDHQIDEFVRTAAFLRRHVP